MSDDKFQVAVIGSGPGGYIAAIRAAQLGFKVVCIEKHTSLGGTCLNVGCIPSKTLLQTTEHLDWLNTSAKEQGIQVKDAHVDFPVMMKRKETIIQTLSGGIASLFKKYKITKIHGNASFTGNNSLQITHGDQVKVINADHIILATGSQPIELPFLPFDEKVVVSSTGALSLSHPPKRLVVVGAGVIGVELASVYRRLGSEVTIIEMLDVITPTMEPAISKQLQLVLNKQGINFLLKAKVVSADIQADSAILTVEHQGEKITLTSDIVLVAIGRKPYTQGLNLESAGIKIDNKGLILIDANFRTTNPHVYAIGDVVEGPMLAHRASHEGIVVCELLTGQKSVVNYMAIPNVIYTNPEVSSVGLTEQEALNAGLEIVTGLSQFKANARARCMGEMEGFVKVIGEKHTLHLLGMHIIGSHASELIAEGVLAINKKVTLKEIANTCHAHPTLSEAIMEACQSACE